MNEKYRINFTFMDNTYIYNVEKKNDLGEWEWTHFASRTLLDCWIYIQMLKEDIEMVNTINQYAVNRIPKNTDIENES